MQKWERKYSARLRMQFTLFELIFRYQFKIPQIMQFIKNDKNNFYTLKNRRLMNE